MLNTYTQETSLQCFFYSTDTSSCNAPNISFTNLMQDPMTALKIQRSSSFMVKAIATSYSHWKARITWRISHLHMSHKTELDMKSAFQSTRIVKQEEVSLKNTTITQWEIIPRTLQYGIYYIEVMVEMKNSSTCINYNYGLLHIKESPLQAVISASPSEEQILQRLYRELKLDASGSFDPDVHKSDKTGFKYTWVCAQHGEKIGDIALLPVVTQNVNMKSLNGKGCYGTGPGKLNFTSSTAMLFLNEMVAEKRYVIKLIVEKDKRTSNITYEFELKNKYSFGLEIR